MVGFKTTLASGRIQVPKMITASVLRTDWTPKLIWFHSWTNLVPKLICSTRNDRRVTWWHDYSSLSTNLDRGNRTDLAQWLIWSQDWSKTDAALRLILPQDRYSPRTDLATGLIWSQYWSDHRTALATGLRPVDYSFQCLTFISLNFKTFSFLLLLLSV